MSLSSLLSRADQPGPVYSSTLLIATPAPERWRPRAAPVCVSTIGHGPVTIYSLPLQWLPIWGCHSVCCMDVSLRYFCHRQLREITFHSLQTDKLLASWPLPPHWSLYVGAASSVPAASRADPLRYVATLRSHNDVHMCA